MENKEENMTGTMEVSTISKHGWNLEIQTNRGKYLGKRWVLLNMKKHLFYMLASALIVSMSLISCKSDFSDIRGPDNNDDLDIFVLNISQETDWNYLVVGKDGSCIFFNVDESNDIPTHLYLKPDKNSDDGFTILFKENGLPDKMITNGHIMYFGNFNGYKFDLSIIYPNNTIDYFYDIETDINWDAYNETTISGQERYISFNSIIKSLNIIGHAIGIGTCATSVFFPPALGACASYVVSTVGSVVVEKVFDGFTENVGKAIINVIGCAGGGISGAIDCVSGLADAVSLLTYLDFNLTNQKTTQINEAIRKIDGDGLTIIPYELLELFYDLGININSGRNPPNIEGAYFVSTLQLMRDTTRRGVAEQWDMYVTFSRQNDTRLTIEADYRLQSDNSPLPMYSSGTDAFIVGEGNQFTVFMDGTREQGGYTAKTVEVFSGELSDTGILNYQWAVFMVDNRGNPLGTWIENGTGYSKRGTAVKFDPNQPGYVNNPIPLTADIWTTSSITSGSFNEMWYSFNVENGTAYRIWWSDYYEGDESHTLDILVSAQYENGTNIFSDIDSAYDTPRSFVANQTGIVKIRVYPYYSGRTGTYALTYSVGSTAMRPSASITASSGRTLTVNHIQGIKESSSKTVLSGAWH